MINFNFAKLKENKSSDKRVFAYVHELDIIPGLHKIIWALMHFSISRLSVWKKGLLIASFYLRKLIILCNSTQFHSAKRNSFTIKALQ